MSFLHFISVLLCFFGFEPSAVIRSLVFRTGKQSSRAATKPRLVGISLWPTPRKLMTMYIFSSKNPLIHVDCNMVRIKCSRLINSRVESYLHSHVYLSAIAHKYFCCCDNIFFNLKLHKNLKDHRWLLFLRATPMFFFRPCWDTDFFFFFCINDSIEQPPWFLGSFICLLRRSLTEFLSKPEMCLVWDLVGSRLEICLLFLDG